MHQLVVFASGKGSNVQAILDYFQSSGKAQIALIVCNNPAGGVLDIAAAHQIPVQLIDRSSVKEAAFVEMLRSHSPSLLVLAGFLWKVPDSVVQAFPARIINIHPALLPKYGGKGMYGQHVHQAVIAAGEKESGITIHYVNEHYDEGGAILQARCALLPEDTHEGLAGRVHKLEHYFFPRTIEFLLDNLS
ncbi:phosphoribosylglycinamide formyltransferase [Taibaiella koreensis]|uniref:phosphoribosylglycinamide formyltransferase n=1 Tax=Taibaiella koreensis TaxID=1268548 RepID=UPI000E59DC7E|nr:phosphoribosylglycinamide formyltransferase [Taibaiella koreensis]